MSTTIKVNHRSVKQLLESGKEMLFVIPEYQRPYAWTEEQIVTLFEDLWDFATNNDEQTYFLGCIVSYINDETQEIIDGQQRITSLFLLLRAIYTELTKTAEDERTAQAKNFIKQIEQAIWQTNEYTGEVDDFAKILLQSNVVTEQSNDVLKHILETGEVDAKAKDNYSLNYCKFLALYEDAAKSNPLKIYEFIMKLLNKAILLPIQADSQETALTIFSTLNNRGLPLSDADIFKSKIYRELDSSAKDSFINSWKELDENARACDETIQQLFYYYMFYLRAKDGDSKSTTPGVRKYFFKINSRQLQNKDLMINLDLILNIWRVANRGYAIDNEDWSINPEIRKIIDMLVSYPNEFWKYPVVTYYLEHRENSNFESLFLKFLRKLFVELFTRYIETPTINAVKSDILKLNVEIGMTAKPKFDFKIMYNADLAGKVKNPHKGTVRMILKALAYMKQDELLPDRWEIEHILPQKWQANYFLNESEENIKDKIEHIGNKLPFEKKLNIVAGNGYLTKKKESYKASKIVIMQDFVSIAKSDWKLDDITERDIRISDDIVALVNEWNEDYAR